MVEYDCEGCGVHVSAFGIETRPAHGFCAVCAWMCEYVTDPEQMEKLRRQQGLLDPRRPGDETLTPETGDAQ